MVQVMWDWKKSGFVILCKTVKGTSYELPNPYNASALFLFLIFTVTWAVFITRALFVPFSFHLLRLLRQTILRLEPGSVWVGFERVRDGGEVSD